MSPTSAGKPVRPMLATLSAAPTGEFWAMEQKWDGQRAIATTGGKHPALYSRNGNDISRSFPEIVNALTEVLDGRDTVLDGEIVALDDRGIPSFSRLQRRMHVQKPAPLLRTQVPVTYYAFDVLDIDGTEIIDLPYIERREALSNLSLNHARIKVPRTGSTSTAPPCST